MQSPAALPPLFFMKPKPFYWLTLTSVFFVGPLLFFLPALPLASPLSSKAWDGATWKEHCQEARTSYNPAQDLSNERLTLAPEDERWPDFLLWVQKHQISAHHLEGLTWKNGNPSGIRVHWAPGSRWERKSTLSFGHALAYLVGLLGWQDTDFPEFFAPQGGTFGLNLKDRLALIDAQSISPWQDFFRFLKTLPLKETTLFQIKALREGKRTVVVSAGRGKTAEVPYKQFAFLLGKVLTDCRAYEFFKAYDQKEGTNPSPGQTVYERECSACHGSRGDGKGPLAEAFSPRPRNFTKGLFRYRSTPTGQLPTDEDLYHTIFRGLPGTTMPAWGPFLGEREIREVVAYIKKFSQRFAQEKPGEPVKIPPPPPRTKESLARGKKLYEDMGCASCHGEDGKGGGSAAEDLKTSEGDPIRPRDLTNKWSFRGGHTPRDVFMRLATGMDGSPMPSYRGMVSDEELWDLVFYILSLSPPTPPQMAAPAEQNEPR